MDDEHIQMENEVQSKVVGKRSVDLQLTFDKKITLINILHLPDMNGGLVSGDLFGKSEIKSSYELANLYFSECCICW